MKALVLSLGVVLAASSSSSSFAAERAFRINEDQISNGLAIAWGVKGEKTDFEAIEKAGDDATYKFRDDKSDQLRNYLVDVERDAIVDEVASGADEPSEIIAHLGSTSFHNHFHLELFADINGGDGLQSDESFAIITSGMKWDGNIQQVYAVKRADGAVAISAKCDDCDQSFVSQLKKHLTKRQIELFETRASDISFTRDPKQEPGMARFKLNSYVPKQDVGTTFSGRVKFSVVAGKVQAKLVSLQMKPYSN